MSFTYKLVCYKSCKCPRGACWKKKKKEKIPDWELTNAHGKYAGKEVSNNRCSGGLSRGLTDL